MSDHNLDILDTTNARIFLQQFPRRSPSLSAVLRFDVLPSCEVGEGESDNLITIYHSLNSTFSNIIKYQDNVTNFSPAACDLMAELNTSHAALYMRMYCKDPTFTAGKKSVNAPRCSSRRESESD